MIATGGSTPNRPQRSPAGEQLIEHHAEREDVACVEWFARCLLATYAIVPTTTPPGVVRDVGASRAVGAGNREFSGLKSASFS